MFADHAVRILVRQTHYGLVAAVISDGVFLSRGETPRIPVARG